MKKEAEEAGGDAILFLRVDMEQLQLSGTQYFVYGTLVKFKWAFSSSDNKLLFYLHKLLQTEIVIK